MPAVPAAPLGRGAALPGRTFGVAYKGCFEPCVNASGQQNLWPFDRELTVFEHSCATAAGSSVCVMQHMWAGGCWPGYKDSRIRYYVDGEPSASVDFPLGLGHGSSMLEDVAQQPWSAGSLFGWTGLPSKGGVFNTYQIPFARSIRVTVTLLTTAPVGQRQHDPVGFWLILRGHAGATSVALPGGLTVLPPHARLRAHENKAVAVPPGGMVPLLQTRAEEEEQKPGTVGDVAVLMVSLAVSSAANGLGFLEGCMRATTPDSTEILLSSGTEDYFLGTFYFESGSYQFPLGGLTRRNSTHAVPVCGATRDAKGAASCQATSGASFSAYRVHTEDSLVLAQGAEMRWRNGDAAGCNSSGPGYSAPVVVDSVVLYYEF